MLGGAELRRHFWSVVGLTLIVAVVVAVVLGFASGARRTSTVLDRFVDATNTPDMIAFVTRLPEPAVLDQVEAELRQLEGVEGLGSVRGFAADAGTAFDFSIIAPSDKGEHEPFGGLHLLEGRLPGPSALDEVTLNEVTADELGLRVGDRLEVDMFTRQALLRLLANEIVGEPQPDGPRLGLEVVGIGRGYEELSGKGSDASPLALASPAFYTEHRDQLALSVSLFGLRTDGSVTEQEVAAVLSGPDGVFEETASVESADDAGLGEVRDAHGVITVALVAFAAIAAAAGLLAIGQAVTRQAALSADVNDAAAALGLTRLERGAAIVVPAIVGVSAGVVVGLVGAVGLSPLFPVSVARLAEVDPGLRLDPLVLLAGGLVALVICIAWVAMVGRRTLIGRSETSVSTRRALLVSKWQGSVASVIGVRMASGGGSDRRSVPVRSALLGAVVGTAGVVAVAVFVATVDDTIDEPARYGYVGTSNPDVFAVDPEAELATIGDEPGIDAVGVLRCGPVQLDSLTRYVCAMEQRKGSMPLTVTAGRAPSEGTEIALGRSVMDDLGVAIGDRVVGRARDGSEVELTVVGEGLVPMIAVRSPGSGGVVTSELMESMFPTIPEDDVGFERNLILRYEPGVDIDELESRLDERYPVTFTAYSRPEAPSQLAQLGRMHALLFGLAVFLGGLGVIGLAQYLAVSVRRRQREFGVLRTIGFRRSDVRRAVSWQALAVAVIGVVLGVPAGVVLGRAAWRLAVADLAILDTPTTPWLLGSLIVVGALSGSWVISTVPGWFASRGRPADALRAE
jgi:hypothetical protein